MWLAIFSTVAGWLRFYGAWIEHKYDTFGPGMYGYMLAICFVFGLYLIKTGPRRA